MLRSMVGAALALMLALTSGSGLRAQETDSPDDDTTELATELVGRPVYARGGVEIGSVADLQLDEAGQPQQLRIRVAARLGLGTRLVEIPKGSFMLLRGAAVIDLPAEMVPLLPEATEPEDDR